MASSSSLSKDQPHPPSSSKLIFAPGSDPSTNQASQYKKGTLSRSDLSPSPITQFHTWFAAAQAYPVPHAEAVTLSTASLPSGRISSRVVYLKELDSGGPVPQTTNTTTPSENETESATRPPAFVIYSNFATSRKAADLATNTHAALVFWWRELERQVRVEGRAERMSAAESQVYFDTRIRSSRIGAWASEQTKVLGDGGASEREELEQRVRDVEKRFEGQEHIPVPPFWGGLRIIPDVIEFWQGRESRLHDRFRYTKVEGSDDAWKIDRLSP